jgi:hypothetical protein
VVNRVAVLAVLVAAAAPARGDSPRLAEARRAVEAVDYDDARRLLVEALHDGDNSPAAVGELYRLSARAAVVLGERDLAEQYYRRWLAIDPGAALPGDAAPKLREPFVAAQAYIAAHGRLIARALRTATGELDVVVISDPLAMARAAAVLGPLDPGAHAPAIPFGDDHRARLTAGSRAAILDENGNRLLELDAAAAASPAGAAVPAPAPVFEVRPWTRRWQTWAIPAGVLALTSAGFGIAAIASSDRARAITDASGQYFLSDAEANVRRGRIFAWITAGSGAVAIGCAIPTAIYYLQQRHDTAHVVMPMAGDGRIGLAVAGRF